MYWILSVCLRVLETIRYHEVVLKRQSMRTIYNYIYYHLFDLVSRFRKLNARESAILYLSTIVFFLTMPFVAGAIRFIGSMPSGVFMTLVVGYGFLISYLNKRYFENPHRLKQIIQKFKNESLILKRIGYFVVVGLFLSSLILFFSFCRFYNY